MPLYKRKKSLIKSNLKDRCKDASNPDYILVKYIEDNLYYVTKNNVKNTGQENVKLVRYSDGKTYAAKIISYGAKQDMNELCKRLQIEQAKLENTESNSDVVVKTTDVQSEDPDDNNLHDFVITESTNTQSNDISMSNNNSVKISQSISDEADKISEFHSVDSDVNKLLDDDAKITEFSNTQSKNLGMININSVKISESNSEVAIKTTDIQSQDSDVNNKYGDVSEITDSSNTQFEDLSMINNNSVKISEFSSDVAVKTTDIQSEDSDVNNLHDADMPESSDTQFKDVGKDTSHASNSINSSIQSSDKDLRKKARCSYISLLPSSSDSCDCNSESDYSCDKTSSSENEIESNIPVKVQMSKSVSNKRIWDKKQSCLYCSKLVCKLARHLENVHSNETEVAKFLALKKNSAARRNIINKLRNKGNFMYNSNVLNKKQGTIIAKKRPRTEVSANDYLPCRFCLAFLNRKRLYIHESTCKFAHDKKKFEKVQGPSSLLLPIEKGASSVLREKVLPIMQQDECTLVCKTDKVILLYGSYLAGKLAHEQHLYVYISQKIREMGRFLIQVRKLTQNSCSLEELFEVSKFDLIIKAVKALAGFCDDTNTYKVPSLAKKIGHSIKKCINILLGHAVQNKMEMKVKQIEEFEKLYNLEWAGQVSSHALRTLYTNKFNKNVVLPVTSDIQKVHHFIKIESERCKQELKNNFSFQEYIILTKLTLAYIILFNRKRVGEAQRITIETYNKRSKIVKDSDIYVSLSETEKILAGKLSRIETRGKKGRGVPILFDVGVEENIDLLLSLRPKVNIPEDNQYLFATKKMTTIRGTDALKYVAKGANIENVNSLTSTNLRKHIATISQLVNLKDNELDQLANFMGHDIRVHREFYRLPNDAVQLAKISKILVSMEKGTISNIEGKTLDEIEIETTSESDDDSTPGSELHKKKRNYTGRRPWTAEEIQVIQTKFAEHILKKTLPGKQECMSCIQEGHLQNRDWKQIKYYIYNVHKKTT